MAACLSDFLIPLVIAVLHNFIIFHNSPETPVQLLTANGISESEATQASILRDQIADAMWTDYLAELATSSVHWGVEVSLARKIQKECGGNVIIRNKTVSASHDGDVLSLETAQACPATPLAASIQSWSDVKIDCLAPALAQMSAGLASVETALLGCHPAAPAGNNADLNEPALQCSAPTSISRIGHNMGNCTNRVWEQNFFHGLPYIVFRVKPLSTLIFEHLDIAEYVDSFKTTMDYVRWLSLSVTKECPPFLRLHTVVWVYTNLIETKKLSEGGIVWDFDDYEQDPPTFGAQQ
ncbi:hypothetical protein K435DRAFT_802197 [Dendrothele bispora CBS 962.96]|uniref:Uncharacterized protein n=1 Tax=Dendrothele bispora (strain CBS 962.96) TaxID=1314807 RepID=A0A4V4HEA7_DENBC|nr:hypothetical protein K435DRAFT_802197 [Dendrothele bispora CBS 962.96]